MTGRRASTPATCAVRWGNNTCELPHGHGGHHAASYVNAQGQTRRRTWLNRWAA